MFFTGLFFDFHVCHLQFTLTAGECTYYLPTNIYSRIADHLVRWRTDADRRWNFERSRASWEHKARNCNFHFEANSQKGAPQHHLDLPSAKCSWHWALRSKHHLICQLRSSRDHFGWPRADQRGRKRDFYMQRACQSRGYDVQVNDTTIACRFYSWWHFSPFADGF